MLQAYATQKALDMLGVDNETICIDGIRKEINKRKYKYYLKEFKKKDVRNEKLKFVKKAVRCRINKELGKNMAVRNKKFKCFAETKFKLSKVYTSFDELTNACSELYSSVLVGSDQLWLPSNIYADYYTLNFVPEKVNKISYSTSFGTANLPDWQKKSATSFLEKIDFLSVREQSGQKLIKELTGRNAEIVCDPTLLFDADEWMDIQDVKPIIDDKYIFCYFLGDNIKHREFVNRLKAETGCKVVTLPHVDAYIKSDENFGDIKLYDVGPDEFVNLIRNAEFVCTDSFHASVFSILNKRKFFTFMRFKSSDKMSTNSRITSLLNIFGLEKRMMVGDENVKLYVNSDIDYVDVQKKLVDFRKSSVDFLKKSTVCK
jgi:hypothetical protein